MKTGGLHPGMAAAGAGACVLIGIAGWLAAPARPIAAGSAPAPKGEPHAPGPIAFFAEHCARCHGAYGADYNENLYQDPSPDRLAVVVRTMIEGQTELTPTPEMMRGQAALAVAMGRRVPFIAWTDRSTDGRTLTGEVTPGAVLSATARGVAVEISLADTVWSLTLPAGAAERDLQITAEWNGKSTRFTPGGVPFAPSP